MNNAEVLVRTVLSATFDKRRLAGTIIAGLCIVAMGLPAAGAANVKIANVSAVGGGMVQFDVSWSDSWRASWTEEGSGISNWDAVWVFVKYRTRGAASWSHATLSLKSADHLATKGAKMDVGVTGKRGMGVFIYRAAEGKGPFACKGVKLKWMHKADKVADPSKVELFVHALEMVYVPRGAFYVGAVGKLAGSFTAGQWRKGQDVIPFKVATEGKLEVAPKPGCLYGTAGPGAAHQMGCIGILPAAFPKGFGAFYCMKYEINQGQYAAFLNQLTEAQAKVRYPLPTIPPRRLRDGSHTVKKTDAGYVAGKPQRACNWVSWDDCTAYLDWSGLRPMTELEFEKACRGPLKPVKDEYAWGTGEPIEADWITKVSVPLPVPLPQGVCGKSGRAKAGCSYWGIAALSGHLRDRTVAVGHKEGWAFTGLCGDGEIADDGFSNVAGWPGPGKNWPARGSYVTCGAGFRGGPWYADKVRLRVSDRFLSSCMRKARDSSYGFRGVRQAPGASTASESK